SAGICGTAADTNGISLVVLTVQRQSDGNFWNGSGWQVGSFPLTVPGTSWNYALAASTLANGETYNVTARSTDNAGNQSTTGTSTFAYDTTLPTVAFTFPASGGLYNSSSWTGSVTGTASDASPGSVASVGVTVQRSTDSEYWNGTTWQVGSFSLPATGTTSWSQ